MISFIIPFHNEEKNLPLLLEAILKVGPQIHDKWELVLVNDGSKDGSVESLRQAIERLKIDESQVQILETKKRMGKGKALLKGFMMSQGEIIVFMDADLQDDPADLPKFLAKIREGYDFVNGWRVKRHDSVSKTLPSKIFNDLLLKGLLRTSFHDINCGFKVIRREILEDISLYGDNYRFLPFMAEKEGYSTTEVQVTHHARKFGKSKYGTMRMIYGLIDTLTTYFIYKFSEKPLHFFGMAGGGMFTIGFLISLYLTIERLLFHELLYRRPVLLFGILMMIMGLQIVVTGIIGELIVYHHRQLKRDI